MRLEPFRTVDGMSFGITREALVARLGEPLRSGRNAAALNEMDYGEDGVWRFQDGGRLEEVTRHAPVLHLGTVAVPFAALADFVRHQDSAAFERAGFLVSPAYGFAFVPAELDWVTALARHCIATWRALA